MPFLKDYEDPNYGTIPQCYFDEKVTIEADKAVITLTVARTKEMLESGRTINQLSYPVTEDNFTIWFSDDALSKEGATPLLNAHLCIKEINSYSDMTEIE